MTFEAKGKNIRSPKLLRPTIYVGAEFVTSGKCRAKNSLFLVVDQPFTLHNLSCVWFTVVRVYILNLLVYFTAMH